MDNTTLINNIRSRSSSYIDTTPLKEEILDAMLRVDRKDFLPEQSKHLSYDDLPLPIGYNQTCSQPSMVAFMLDKLNIKKGDKVLEIGCGCGYAAAIASILVGNEGMIYTVEIITQLAEMSIINLAQYRNNIEIINTDGSIGLKSRAPFNKIFLSAGVSSNNFDRDILLQQLTDDGILLYPEAYGHIYRISKTNNKYLTESYYGVSFVPLNGANS